MTKKITQKIIATALGISQSSVSLYLKDPDTQRLSPKVKHEINAYLDKNAPEMLPVKISQKQLLFCYPKGYSAESPFTTRVLDGASQEASANNMRCLFQTWETPEDIIELVKNGEIDGVMTIEVPAAGFIKEIQQYVPYVVINRTVDDTKCDQVNINNRAVMHAAVNHLYRLGHKNIYYITNDNLETMYGHLLERVGGFMEGIMMNGDMPAQDQIICLSHDEDEAISQLAPYFNREEKPTAFICYNDGVAINVIKHLQKMDISVPDDVSIIGFDNSDLSSIWSPAITTINQNREDMGRAAVELLNKKISGEETAFRTVLCHAELIIRESTAKCLKRNN